MNDTFWKIPVHAGDTLYGEFEVKDKQELSNPEKGILSLSLLVRNQREELVGGCLMKIFMAY